MDGNRYERLLNSVRKIVLEKYYFYFPRYNREIGDKKKSLRITRVWKPSYKIFLLPVGFFLYVREKKKEILLFIYY